MRALWSGSIAFGLINIPVRVYSASEERSLDFHMLHKKDHSPIRFARICQAEGKEVPYEEIEKGFEYSKGQYVVVAEKDFKEASAKKTSTLDIQQFALLEDINPLYFEKPYYLEPDKKAAKAYRLLQEALSEAGKVAIVNFVFHHREHVGALIATKEGLLLLQMRYFSEIRSPKELDIPKEQVSAKELEMACVMIERLSKPFHPQDYEDTYTEELMGAIEQKLKGKKGVKGRSKKEKVAPQGTASDLMSLLQASVKKALHESEPEPRNKGLSVEKGKRGKKKNLKGKSARKT